MSTLCDSLQDARICPDSYESTYRSVGWTLRQKEIHGFDNNNYRKHNISQMTEEIIKFGYKHLEPGHPDNPKPYAICGAKTRGETAKGPLCRLKAGYKTAHVGVGRCWLHGGNMPSGPDHYNFKGGRYSHIWKGRLREHIEAISQDGSNPLDLLPELEVARVTLGLALDRLMAAPVQPGSVGSRAKNGNVEDVGANALLDTVGEGGGASFQSYEDSADIPDAEFFSFPDPELSTETIAPVWDMRLVNPDDINLVRECTNDIVNTVSKMIAARNQTAMTRAETAYILSIMKEAINRFVPKENREAFVRYLMEMVPVEAKSEE